MKIRNSIVFAFLCVCSWFGERVSAQTTATGTLRKVKPSSLFSASFFEDPTIAGAIDVIHKTANFTVQTVTNSNEQLHKFVDILTADIDELTEEQLDERLNQLVDFLRLKLNTEELSEEFLVQLESIDKPVKDITRREVLELLQSLPDIDEVEVTALELLASLPEAAKPLVAATEEIELNLQALKKALKARLDQKLSYIITEAGHAKNTLDEFLTIVKNTIVGDILADENAVPPTPEPPVVEETTPENPEEIETAPTPQPSSPVENETSTAPVAPVDPVPAAP